MSNEEIINVVKVVGDRICVTADDGEKVYSAIIDALHKGKKVKISFNDVTDLTSVFLNNAIGKLYGKFNEAFIRSNISVTDISTNDVVILKRVVDRAKSFFDDHYSEHYIRAANEVLGDDSGT